MIFSLRFPKWNGKHIHIFLPNTEQNPQLNKWPMQLFFSGKYTISVNRAYSIFMTAKAICDKKNENLCPNSGGVGAQSSPELSD